MLKNIDFQGLNKFILAGEAEIVDVRELDEFNLIKLQDSKLIPMGEILNRLDEVDWDKKVVLICRTGSRSKYIAQKLAELGKTVYDLQGGIKNIYLLDRSKLIFTDKDLVDKYF